MSERLCSKGINRMQVTLVTRISSQMILVTFITAPYFKIPVVISGVAVAARYWDWLRGPLDLWSVSACCEGYDCWDWSPDSSGATAALRWQPHKRGRIWRVLGAPCLVVHNSFRRNVSFRFIPAASVAAEHYQSHRLTLPTFPHSPLIYTADVKYDCPRSNWGRAPLGASAYYELNQTESSCYEGSRVSQTVNGRASPHPPK